MLAGQVTTNKCLFVQPTQELLLGLNQVQQTELSPRHLAMLVHVNQYLCVLADEG